MLFGAPLGLDVVLFLAGLLCLVAELGGFFVVGVFDGIVLGDRELLDVGFKIGQVWWLGHGFDADAGAGLVDNIDGLVWLDSACDVAAREFNGGADRGVGVLDAVVLFVLRADAFEDFNGLLVAWWFDGDGLETTIKGGVFFDVFAVLVEGSCANALDLAAGHCWLEDIGRVDRTLGTACTNERVEFIDEEDDVSGAADFVHDGFNAFFELAAVLGTRDHHREVEAHNPFSIEDVGDFLVSDALGEAFDDGGFADACFAQENWVVLGAAAEDLGEAFDFMGAADDGVELAGFGEFGKVTPEGIECGGFGFAFGL